MGVESRSSGVGPPEAVAAGVAKLGAAGAREWGRRRVRALLRARRWARDRGATTAEFAIVTMAAVGFAGLLVVILRSDGVRMILEDLVQRALSAGG